MSARPCISCCRKVCLGKWHIADGGPGTAQEEFSGSGSNSVEGDKNRHKSTFILSCFICEI